MKLHEILIEGKVSPEGLKRLQNIQEEIDSYKEEIEKLAKAFAIKEPISAWFNGEYRYGAISYYTKEELDNDNSDKLVSTLKETKYSYELLFSRIRSFNALPWRKRLFRKV